jgi:predicted nucleotidyltransferase
MNGSAELRLSAAQIELLLRAVGAQLNARGEHAELFLVGGAAIALGYDGRRLTADVDAVFEPKAIVLDIAREVAQDQEHVAENWLNDGVKGFLPGEDPDARVLLDIPGLTVKTASVEYLLALKVYASRVDRDQDDILYLAGLAGVTSASEVLAIAERIVGADKLPTKAQYLVQALFPEAPASEPAPAPQTLAARPAVGPRPSPGTDSSRGG